VGELMEKSFAPRDVDNGISFRASPRTLQVLSEDGRKLGIYPSVAARRILYYMAEIGPIHDTLELVSERLLVFVQLIQSMLSEVAAERFREAENFSRRRTIPSVGTG